MFWAIWFPIDRDDWWLKLVEILVGSHGTIFAHQVILIFRLRCLWWYLIHMLIQFLQHYILSIIAGCTQHILMRYTTLLVVYLSRFSAIFCLVDLYSYKKVLSEQQQQQLKSSWHLSDLSSHIKHRGYVVMEYAAIFPTWKPRLVYCTCFTAMERCYSYRESKMRYYWSNWWPIYSVTWVSLDRKTSGLEFILSKVLSCLQAVFFLHHSDSILTIIP